MNKKNSINRSSVKSKKKNNFSKKSVKKKNEKTKKILKSWIWHAGYNIIFLKKSRYVDCSNMYFYMKN